MIVLKIILYVLIILNVSFGQEKANFFQNLKDHKTFKDSPSVEQNFDNEIIATVSLTTGDVEFKSDFDLKNILIVTIASEMQKDANNRIQNFGTRWANKPLPHMKPSIDTLYLWFSGHKIENKKVGILDTTSLELSSSMKAKLMRSLRLISEKFIIFIPGYEATELKKYSEWNTAIYSNSLIQSEDRIGCDFDFVLFGIKDDLTNWCKSTLASQFQGESIRCFGPGQFHEISNLATEFSSLNLNQNRFSKQNDLNSFQQAEQVQLDVKQLRPEFEFKSIENCFTEKLEDKIKRGISTEINELEIISQCAQTPFQNSTRLRSNFRIRNFPKYEKCELSNSTSLRFISILKGRMANSNEQLSFFDVVGNLFQFRNYCSENLSPTTKDCCMNARDLLFKELEKEYNLHKGKVMSCIKNESTLEEARRKCSENMFPNWTSENVSTIYFEEFVWLTRFSVALVLIIPLLAYSC